MVAKHLVALACCTAVTFSQAAIAQEFPSHPLTFVVPFGPGGATDVFARTMGVQLTTRLGKQVVVVNRPGAESITAATTLTKATPDGHTLMLATNVTMAVNVTRYKKLPYDPVKDFAPVAMVGSAPFALVVNTSLPVQSLPDLIKLAKAKPGELSYLSSGEGTGSHLGIELLSDMTGMKLRHVLHKAGGPAITGLVSGEASMMLSDFATSRFHIEGGAVRALGVSSKARSEIAPDLPTIAEAGVPGFDLSAWWMVVVPAGTPRDAVRRLEAAVKATVASLEIQEKLIVLGYFPAKSTSAEELGSFVKSEITHWGKAVELSGAIVDQN